MYTFTSASVMTTAFPSLKSQRQPVFLYDELFSKISPPVVVALAVEEKMEIATNAPETLNITTTARAPVTANICSRIGPSIDGNVGSSC